MIDYVNKVTNESDPMIVNAPGSFVHLSTAKSKGWSVRDCQTGKIY
jgi:hypothetical protein